ncbi:hypothetical protein, partial [Gemmiger sp.]|uniref:hypothetical protein n=1 Tax=Gemmiger sp. TaxID=2049027 RepID=UPI003A915E8D
MLDKTSSIICAFGLASAAPRSPYRHLELCGIAIKEILPMKKFCAILFSFVLIVVLALPAAAEGESAA